MKKIVTLFIFVMLICSNAYAISVDGYPELPDFEQSHYVIYREATRDNRVELAAFDIEDETEEDCIVWDNTLQLFYANKYKNGRKWYLDGSEWVFFEEGYYAISNYPADVMASDLRIMDIRAMSELDPRIEVMQKEPGEKSTIRLFFGGNFIGFESDNGLLSLTYSPDGVAPYSSIPLGKIRYPFEIACLGDRLIFFESPVMPRHPNVMHGSYGNSPEYILDSSYNIIGTKEFVGYNTCLCVYNGRCYFHNIDYTNVKQSDRGKLVDNTISTYYYTENGFDWIEVSKEEAIEVMKKAENEQNNYIPYNILDKGKALQSKADPGKIYEIVREYDADQLEQKSSSPIACYRVPRYLGKYSYMTSMYDWEKGEYRCGLSSRTYYYISLDGMNGIRIPNIYHGIYWCTDEYLYIDVNDNEYYRIPMKYLTDNIIVLYNNKALAFDTPPVVEDGRTLVPMRFLFEQMGADVEWDGETQTATVTKQDDVISFSIDNTEAAVNNQIKTMDVPARLINDKTMIPLRFLSEELGCKVEWDEASKTVTITE